MPSHPEHSISPPLFELGQVVATPSALSALAESREEPLIFLRRHICGDWAEMDTHDQKANALAVKEGQRILSAYRLRSGRKLWIITEWDRSVTTLLLPEEY